MSARLAAVSLFVRDLTRAEQFYGATLGWQVIGRSAGSVLMGPREGEPSLALFEYAPDGFEPPLALGCRSIGFELPSPNALARAFDRLLGARATLLATGDRWSIHTTDPDGTRLEIFCRTGAQAGGVVRALTRAELEEGYREPVAV